MTTLNVRVETRFRWIGRYPSGRWREVFQVWEEIHIWGPDLVTIGLTRLISFDLNVTVSGANLLGSGRSRRFAFSTYRHSAKGVLGIWGDSPSGDEFHVIHELGQRAGVHLLNETAHGPSWLS